MNDNHDFAEIRNLLALCRQDLPQDTQVEDFLTEFHRRQRSQLLVRQSLLGRSVSWTKEMIARFELVPSLSYGAVAAALALTAIVGLTQEVAVTNTDGQSRFSFHMPVQKASFAMLPGALTVSPKLSESPNFTPSRAESAATRYVLATNSQGANDATVAF